MPPTTERTASIGAQLRETISATGVPSGRTNRMKFDHITIDTPKGRANVFAIRSANSLSNSIV
jgi:hypothetical protein